MVNNFFKSDFDDRLYLLYRSLCVYFNVPAYARLSNNRRYSGNLFSRLNSVFLSIFSSFVYLNKSVFKPGPYQES